MDAESSFEFISTSAKHTEAIGRVVGEHLSGGAVLALVGTLGAGKTLFTRGVAMGNRLPDGCYVSSPTFALVNEYPGTLNLFHLDAYRLSGALELDSLGFEEMCGSGGAVLVEWADRVEECIPADHLLIEFDVIDEHARRIKFIGRGEQSCAIVHAVKQNAESLVE